MDANLSSRKYAELLARWANGQPNRSKARRDLFGPLTKFAKWHARLTCPYYDRRFGKSVGYLEDDFVAECRILLLRWARRNKNLIPQPDFTDRRLAGLISVIAQRFRDSLYRKHNKRPYESLDEYDGESENDRPQKIPTELTRTQQHFLLDRFPRIDRCFECARLVVLEFVKMMEPRIKMFQTLEVLRHYCERISQLLDYPPDWLLIFILATQRKHLPDECLENLSLRFPNEPPKRINSRVRYLKRSMRELLFGRGELMLIQSIKLL